MNRVDYDKLMRRQIEELCGRKAKLLLHSCCAPCSSACLERLKESFDITVFYYNPNIEEGEYRKRKAEQQRLLEQTDWADFLDCDHSPEDFYGMARGLEAITEGGERCLKCYALRIGRTAETAEKLGYEYFASTLTISPQKSSAAINAAGERAQQGRACKWLYSDFKKQGGYLRSCELAKEHGLYRQNYCGCVFSRREAKDRASLRAQGEKPLHRDINS